MGYTIDKRKQDMVALDSDYAADFIYGLSKIIVAQLRKQEKITDNYGCNTSGIINVALTLQDCFKEEGFRYSPLTDYAKDFVERFEKYIEKQAAISDEKWDGKSNKNLHINTYRKILGRIKKLTECS